VLHRLILTIAFCTTLGLALSAHSQNPSDSSASSSSRSHRSAVRAKATPDTASLANGIYHNNYFGFTYKPPFGWVDRTEDMQQDVQLGKSFLLLATFERPPEAAGDTINSAVVITAESISTYPGLKTAADYFGPLTEVTSGKGFSVVNQPYQVSVGTKQLVRSDFSKGVGSLVMRQASLAMVDKGYVVLFSLIGGSEEEVEQLIGKLAFSPNAGGPAHK
jgi:hypothetical protein